MTARPFNLRAVAAGRFKGGIPGRAKNFPYEYHEQVKVANFMRAQYPHILFTASAGGMRTSIGTAVKMRQMGYSRGTPDLMIFHTHPVYSALFIEMKAAHKGDTSKDQDLWLERLNALGYKAIVCHGAAEAEQAIAKYVRGDEF